MYVCSDKDTIRDDMPLSLCKHLVFSNGILDMLDIWNHPLAIRRIRQQKHAPWWSSKHGLRHAGPYCVFSKKAAFDIWTTGCISLYCLTDADVGPLRLCFCSVSGTLEFSRLLLSSGPLDSWILDAAQYQQLYKMIISLIFMEQFFSCHSLSLE